MSLVSRKSIISFVLFAALPFAAKAQGVTSRSIEVSANGGITNVVGADNKKGHGSFGFSGAYNLTERIALVADYNYLMLGSLEEEGITAKENFQMYGVATRISLLRSRVAVPYVLVGGGGTRDNATASAGSISVSAHRSGGYFATGGGVSIFAGHGFGIRPEFRYDRQEFGATSVDGFPIAGSGGYDLRGTVALFYQFGGRSRSY